MVRLKFTQKFLQTRPAAGLAKHPFKRIHLFSLNVLVYIRLVKLVLQHATYRITCVLKTNLGPESEPEQATYIFISPV